jgi:hypothetical protein
MICRADQGMLAYDATSVPGAARLTSCGGAFDQSLAALTAMGEVSPYLD